MAERDQKSKWVTEYDEDDPRLFPPSTDDPGDAIIVSSVRVGQPGCASNAWHICAGVFFGSKATPHTSNACQMGDDEF